MRKPIGIQTGSTKIWENKPFISLSVFVPVQQGGQYITEEFAPEQARRIAKKLTEFADWIEEQK